MPKEQNDLLTMTPTISPPRLTIVDFMGVFLPGIVWAILLLTFREMILFPNLEISPLTVVSNLTTKSDMSEEPMGAVFYTGLFIGSLILGYIIKALSSKPAEYLSYPPYWFQFVRRRLSMEDVFPYTAKYKDTQYFQAIEKLIRDKLGYDWRVLPGYQPFETCKHLLKLHVPVLWVEVEQREAQVRMVASLFLALCFSFILSIIEYSWIWGAISLIGLVVLAHTFRNRRHREVEDVYVSTVVAKRVIEYGFRGEAEKAANGPFSR